MKVSTDVCFTGFRHADFIYQRSWQVSTPLNPYLYVGVKCGGGGVEAKVDFLHGYTSVLYQGGNRILSVTHSNDALSRLDVRMLAYTRADGVMEDPRKPTLATTHIENRRLFDLAGGRNKVEEWERDHLHACKVCQSVL